MFLAEYTLVAFRKTDAEEMPRDSGFLRSTEMSGIGSMCNIPAIPAHFTDPTRLLAIGVGPFLQLSALPPAPGRNAILL